MLKQKTMGSNVLTCTKLFLDELSVSYSGEYVENFLLTHENYPSLSSISGVLSDFKVEHVAIKISREQLLELTYPCITLIDIGNSKYFVVLNEVTPERVKYNLDEKMNIEPLQDFISKWQGIVLLAKADHLSKSPNNDKYVKEQKEAAISKITVWILMILPPILILLLVRPDINILLLMILKLIGVIASWILLANDIGIRSKLFHQICSIGKDSDGCERITKSKASTVFGFKMSEIGLAYFIGGLFLLLVIILSHNHQSINLVFIATAIALPYTFFSFYYQIRVVKQICLLCTTIMILIWLEFIVFYYYKAYEYINFYDVKSLILALLCYSFPIIFWLPFRRIVLKFSKFEKEKGQLAILKKSKQALRSILDQKRINLNTGYINPIVMNIGNGNKIVAVLSLFCKPCADAFLEMHHFVSTHKNTELNVIIFPGDLVTNQILRNLLKLQLKGDTNSALDFLKNWYSFQSDKLNDYGGDFSKEEADKVESIILSWQKWLDENEISATPSIYINGFKKPNIFSIDDFAILLEEEEEEN